MASPIFEFADRLIEQQAALDPCSASMRGIPGFDHLLTDYSPAGFEARADVVRRGLTELQSLPVTSDDDRLARGFIIERFETELLAHDTGEWQRTVRAITAPAEGLRATFDLMPRDGEEAWTNMAARLELVPDALAGLRSTYESGRAHGRVAAKRQAEAAAHQSATWAQNRWFDTLATEAQEAGVREPVVARLRAGAEGANAAYGAFADYLRVTYMPDATEADGCGPERYAVGIRESLGADLDPDEMYQWAWTDFHQLRAEIRTTCDLILPGASFAGVVDLLDHDPERAVHGVDAYRDWLQALTDDALRRSHEHFEIPEVMNRCDAFIPPEGAAAGAYYATPSEDFSRPGSTWYPALGRTMFPMWGDVTTCYHESVPGHHLQLGYALYQAGSLSRIQRNSFISGHGEGWALYAERLCDEFGWFDKPDHRLGFLRGQMLRSVRVIIDIGMHLGKRIPDGTTLIDGTPFHGGEMWNADLGLAFALSETGNTEVYMRSEIDRYLGWPAQAISYKVGEREWLAARQDARSRDGGAFDLRAWHTKALRLGAMGLGQLRTELAR